MCNYKPLRLLFVIWASVCIGLITPNPAEAQQQAPGRWTHRVGTPSGYLFYNAMTGKSYLGRVYYPTGSFGASVRSSTAEFGRWTCCILAGAPHETLFG
jgi:hypothetical protein